MHLFKIILVSSFSFFACQSMDTKKNMGIITEKANSGRRAYGGGYMQQYAYYSSQTRIMAMVRTLSMNLLGDADSKVKKIGFIKSWAEKGVEGKAALTAKLIVSAQKLYNRMAKMYIFCFDNLENLGYIRQLDNFISLKKMGMELDHIVQAILEFENQDPSGRMYGRRSAGGAGDLHHQRGK